jgi:AraC-like DNA-binding protein/mannose-6-phosphate isomerase-like protein (cupin superfamily)
VKVQPVNEFMLWRSEDLFNIDFASYTLYHHSFSRHFHDHYVIELVIKGADTFYCGGKTYTAQNNQLVLINPGEVHTGSTVLDTPLRYFSLYPDQKTIQQIAEVLQISLPANFSFSQTLLDQSSLTNKFGLLFNSLHSNKSALQQQEIFFGCMHDLLLQPANINYPLRAVEKKDLRIQLLIDFIRSHFEEDISLRQMADLVRLNPFHLVRLFKKNTGVSPYEYLLIIRAEYAKQLMRKGYKVREAALQSGFYDTSHLNRSLHKIAGTSPKSFLSSKSQFRTSFNS